MILAILILSTYFFYTSNHIDRFLCYFYWLSFLLADSMKGVIFLIGERLKRYTA